MILSIGSSLNSFKSVNLHKGLNLLLADAKDDQASGKTRNSAGKSSFVLIVDFLLGANCDKKSVFKSDTLLGESFNGRFLIKGTEVHIERSGGDSSKIFVLDGLEVFKEGLNVDKDSGKTFITLGDWKRFLGQAFFKLPYNPEGTDFSEKNGPTVRSLIKYFLRLDGDGGFSYPERSYASQRRSSWQAAMSFMLGLEWRIPQDFQKVRDKEKALDTLKKAAEGGVIGDVVGTVAKIRPQLAIAEKRVNARRTEIAEFQVIEAYKNLTDEAASFQRTMQETSRRLVSLKETIAFLTDALETEAPAYKVDIKSMYEASGIELPEVALRRFDEVEAFQKSILTNRKIHLQSQVEQTQRDIEAANEQLTTAGRARKSILASLQGRGAFEDLVELQKELARMEAEYANLQERMTAAEALEGDKADLKVDRIELQRRLQADHATHADLLKKLILRIAELIAELYDNREGRLEISATENGPEFEIHIEGDRGTGIRSMEVFCMDIALFEAVKDRLGGTGFLIHDSHLFDGVDARQIRTALLLGQSSADENQQYIVTLNSDIFETLDFPGDFEIEEVVISTRLSDEGDTGGLFGLRFD